MILKQKLLTNSIRAVMLATFGVVILFTLPLSLSAKNELKVQPMVSKLVTPPTPPTSPNLGVSNHAPVITTRNLPIGEVGKNYIANLAATDRDGDTMSMNIYNLPSGLSLGACKQSEMLDRSFLTCVISGKPTTTFSGRVLVDVIDERGGLVQKEFKLEVK